MMNLVSSSSKLVTTNVCRMPHDREMLVKRSDTGKGLESEEGNKHTGVLVFRLEVPRGDVHRIEIKL